MLWTVELESHLHFNTIMTTVLPPQSTSILPHSQPPSHLAPLANLKGYSEGVAGGIKDGAW